MNPLRSLLSLLLFALPVAAEPLQLPLAFEPNQGQRNAAVQFLAHSRGYSLLLTQQGLNLGFQRPVGGKFERQHSPIRPTWLSLEWLGAKASFQGQKLLPGQSNYLIGSNPRQWHTHIPQYAQALAPELYPGVGVRFYSQAKGRLEYDFEVAPGADPQQIKLRYRGTTALRLDKTGAVVLSVPGGSFRQPKPYAYQVVSGQRQAVPVSYVLQGQQVSFQLGRYQPSLPLIIDPILDYAAFVGGSGFERGYGLGVDSTGAVYLGGQTNSLDLGGTAAGGEDAFVAKLDPTGSTVLYATCLGGSGYDAGYAVAVYSSGSAYLTGETSSTDFPLQNAVQGVYRGNTDLFVSKLSPDGASLVYSTYLGGSDGDYGYGIAVDSNGEAFVTGTTLSANFPAVKSLQATNGGGFDSFITKFKADGSGFFYSTYLGGTGDEFAYGIALDSARNAYITGDTSSTNFPTQNPFQSTRQGLIDAFVSKLNAAGSSLLASTYLGGTGGDFGRAIAVDASQNSYVTGGTDSTDFPLQGPIQSVGGGGTEAFITKLNGNQLIYSTYLGGQGLDFGYGIAVNAQGVAVVTGETTATDFPVAVPTQSTNGGGLDAFVTQVNSAGSSFIYSTYLGGSGDDEGFALAEDSLGTAYVTGVEASTNFPTPTASPSPAGDAFVVRLSVPVLGSPTLSSFSPSGAPIGASVTLTGTNFTGDTLVQFNGITATAVINSTTQATVTVPVGATSGPIVLTNPQGAATSAANFEVTSVAWTIAPSSQAIDLTTSATYTLTLDRSNGFTGTITPTLLGLPPGATATFSPALLNDPDTVSTLTVTAPNNATSGTYTLLLSDSAAQLFPVATSLTVNAVNGSLTDQTGGNATVQNGPLSQKVRFRQQITLTNTTGTALIGPVFLAIEQLPTGVTATQVTNTSLDTTSLQSTTPSPLALVLPFGATLANQASATVLLEFDNPTLFPLSYTLKVRDALQRIITPQLTASSLSQAKRVSQLITVTNSSNFTLNGPFYIAIQGTCPTADPPQQLCPGINPTTATSKLPLPSVYPVIGINQTTLPPAGVITAVLEFDNPTLSPLTYSAHFYSR